jgi:hypothetical protein
MMGEVITTNDEADKDLEEGHLVPFEGTTPERQRKITKKLKRFGPSTTRIEVIRHYLLSSYLVTAFQTRGIIFNMVHLQRSFVLKKFVN